MTELTFEAVRKRIRQNFPTGVKTSNHLTWCRETATSMISSDNRFRISKALEGGVPVYVAEQCATSTSKAIPIGGRFENADQAKEAVAFHL